MRSRFLIIALIFLALLCMCFSAQAITSGNYLYELTNKNDVRITQYNGDSADVAIPASFDGHFVVEIGNSAFAWHSSIVSVIIPEKVTYIGQAAFEACTGLENITFSKALKEM